MSKLDSDGGNPVATYWLHSVLYCSSHLISQLQAGCYKDSYKTFLRNNKYLNTSLYLRMSLYDNLIHF